MERVVLRHLKGSKATQVEEFALHQFSELVIGRDPSAGVRFDPEKDDVVGRQHARITRDPNDKYKFAVIDLSSRNGTYVNKKRVIGQTWLSPGDVVQLGAGGPEFQFDIDPLPTPLVKATRLPMGAAGATTVVGMPENRVGAGVRDGSGVLGASAAPKEAGEAGEAAEQQEKQLGRRLLWLGAAAGILVILAVTAWQIRKNRTEQVGMRLRRAAALQTAHAETTMGANELAAARAGVWRADEVHAKYAGAVVQIDFSWKLVYAPTGGQVYHYHVPNQFSDAQGNVRAFYDDGRRTIPAYIAGSGGTYEPYLTLSSSEGTAIGASTTGSGFVVTPEGHILSNRHVVANYRVAYQFRQSQTGVAVNGRGQLLLEDGVPILVEPPNNWIPSETKQSGPKGALGVFQPERIYLYVSFPRNPRRNEAQIARLTEAHDAALIKVSTPQSLPTVTLQDNYQGAQPDGGENVFVMGYPASSAAAPSAIWTREQFKRDAETRAVPDPTITTGILSRVVRGTGTPDQHQVSFGGASGGTSGGPLFDEYGRVIGIFCVVGRSDGTATFAVPIKYGQELMSAARTGAQ